MTDDRTGRTAVVTGGSRGIELAIARAPLARGASVVLTSRSDDAARAGAHDLDSRRVRGVGAQRVRVNAIAPSVIRTTLSRPLWEGREADANAATLLGRLGTVDEVATAVCYLLSDAAASITGETLVMDGGERPAVHGGRHARVVGSATRPVW
jgi:NAD(P)-dependent dehydrogenase (short-subunit alcohol dehydrogenase family)